MNIVEEMLSELSVSVYSGFLQFSLTVSSPV